MAEKEGFSLCGIARSRPLDHHAGHLQRWLSQGLESGLEYMRRNSVKRSDPGALVENARTVVVCAVNYKNTAWDQTARGVSPRIASYIYAPDYHTTVKSMLHALLGRIGEEYPQASGRCFCDTAPILEKAWAVEAGLGWTGRNSLLITPSHGSFVFLGEIVLDMECDEYDTPYTGNGCGSCMICMDACPNRAIVSPRVIDTGRCISRLTLERMPQGCTPRAGELHGWIAGCDQCQSCCPHNRHTPLANDPRFMPVVSPSQTTPEFWAKLTREEFDRHFSSTTLVRVGFDGLRSRIAALGAPL